MTAAAPADTFPKLLIRNAKLFGARPAMRQKDLGIWQTWTWSETLEIVRAYAVGLNKLGLKRGETIAIVGANRPKLYWTNCWVSPPRWARNTLWRRLCSQRVRQLPKDSRHGNSPPWPASWMRWIEAIRL